MSAVPFRKLSKEPLPDPCHCTECDGGCSRRIRKKWFQCNPCTKGYHWAPCEVFQPDRLPLLVFECERCGWLEEEH